MAKIGEKEAQLKALRERVSEPTKPSQFSRAMADIQVNLAVPVPAARIVIDTKGEPLNTSWEELGRALAFYRKHRERQKLAGKRRRAAKVKKRPIS